MKKKKLPPLIQGSLSRIFSPYWTLFKLSAGPVATCPDSRTEYSHLRPAKAHVLLVG
jgi:hypothetical protein